MLLILGQILMLAGAIAIFLGAVGLLRLPDFFTRIHAVSVKDSLGLPLLILGLALQCTSWLDAFKLLMLLLFILFTTPAACHALARVALRHKGEDET